MAIGGQAMEHKKELPEKQKKAEIKIKENTKAAALKRAPDEVIAKAIHEALSKK